jgi:DNA-directed RNA polymerase sigma subunit (sigma70/sigma32)
MKKIPPPDDFEPIPFAGIVDLNKPEMSRAKIGKLIGASRETVSNIEEKALKKLRKELFKRGITKEDLF